MVYFLLLGVQRADTDSNLEKLLDIAGEENFMVYIY
jgi:hypothetical protein